MNVLLVLSYHDSWLAITFPGYIVQLNFDVLLQFFNYMVKISTYRVFEPVLVLGICGVNRLLFKHSKVRIAISEIYYTRYNSSTSTTRCFLHLADKTHMDSLLYLTGGVCLRTLGTICHYITKPPSPSGAVSSFDFDRNCILLKNKSGSRHSRDD